LAQHSLLMMKRYLISMNQELRNAARAAGSVVGLTLLVIAVLATLIWLLSDWEFRMTLGACLLIGGTVILYAGSIMNAGGAERSAVMTALTKSSGDSGFLRQDSQVAQGGKGSRYYFMVLMVIAGIIMVAAGFIVMG